MSYQGDPTEIELSARREPLETSAALYMGLLLFAFSRLDLSLQQYLDRVAPGTDDRSELPLQRLMAFAGERADPVVREGFLRCGARVRELAGLREALTTGRWIPDARRGCIVYRAGPQATAPAALEYRLSDFVSALAHLKELQADFQRLCAIERSGSLAVAG